MRKVISMLLVFFTTFAFTCCSDSENSNPEVKSEISLPIPTIKKIWVQRSGNFISVPEDSLKATFIVKDPIDSLLIVLSDSIQKKGKYFDTMLAAFEKVNTDAEVIYYLYPEFSSHHSSRIEDDGTNRSTMTIHYLKKTMVQRDTLFYSWVEADERKSSFTPEKRILTRGSFFIEIGCPIGYNNAYHQSKNVKEAATWISNLLYRDDRDTITGEAADFYDIEMQFNSAVSIRFEGLHSTDH